MNDIKLTFKLDKYKAPKGQLFSLEGRSFDFDNDRYSIFPGFCDVHVHFREPGFSYKETMSTGCAAAAAGGYTAVCTMPNLNPVPDCRENLNVEKEIIKRDAFINVLPYAAITAGEKGEHLSDLEAMAPYVAGFSDDGHGLQSDELMEQAMLRAKALGKLIVAHCEVNSLLKGGCIHDGDYARAHGHKGICSESEYAQVERDLKLVEKTGCSYHVCHVSTKESVELIRKAKARGLDVSCETAPHYLLLDDSMLQEDGRFKMNPPVRSREDRLALIEGIKDGTIRDHCHRPCAPLGGGEVPGAGKERLRHRWTGDRFSPAVYQPGAHRRDKPAKAAGTYVLEPETALRHPNGRRILPVGSGRELQDRPGGVQVHGPLHSFPGLARVRTLPHDRIQRQSRL